MSGAREHAARVVLLRNVFDNLGDLAMLESEVRMLRSTVPQARLQVLTDFGAPGWKPVEVEWGASDVVLSSPVSTATRGLARNLARVIPEKIGEVLNRAAERVAEHRREDSLARLSLTESDLPQPVSDLLENLRRADLVVAGGSLIGRFPAVSEPRRAVLACLRRWGVPYVLHGLTCTDEYSDGTYSGAALAVARDRTWSPAVLVKCGLAEGRVVTYIDPAFVQQDTDEAALQELRASGLRPGEFIAVNVRQSDGEDILPDLVQALQALLERCGLKKVLLFGMQQYRTNDDGHWLERLRRYLQPPLETVVWPFSFETRKLRTVISQARAVVGFRYHAALLALAAGVPAMSLTPRPEYAPKLQGVYEWYGLPECCVPFGKRLGAGQLTFLADEEGRLRRTIAEKNRELLRQASLPYERIRTLLDERA